MKIFLLGIAMLVAIGFEIHRLGCGESDAWMHDLSLEKLFAMQRCAIGAIMLAFSGLVMMAHHG